MVEEPKGFVVAAVFVWVAGFAESVVVAGLAVNKLEVAGAVEVVAGAVDDVVATVESVLAWPNSELAGFVSVEGFGARNRLLVGAGVVVEVVVVAGLAPNRLPAGAVEVVAAGVEAEVASAGLAPKREEVPEVAVVAAAVSGLD